MINQREFEDWAKMQGFNVDQNIMEHIMGLKQEKWFAKDGSVFSVEKKLKRTQDFRFAKNFEINESVMLNVGNDVAKHVVELHNAWLDEQKQKETIGYFSSLL